VLTLAALAGARRRAASPAALAANLD